jgi:phenylpropionate dioxygenase-like ring-hydroxylating dioxygenase large terminal subunit
VEWRAVAASGDIPVGGVLPIEFDGERLVLWRSESGVLAACDARCPHQWADLGEVGVIDGEELVCLSHLWRFAIDGTASKLAMNGRRDDKGSARTHELREVGGRVELVMTAG